jgi:hypothetical protein
MGLLRMYTITAIVLALKMVKRVAGKQYLFRTRDRRGNGKSLGPRSPEAE